MIEYIKKKILLQTKNVYETLSTDDSFETVLIEIYIYSTQYIDTYKMILNSWTNTRRYEVSQYFEFFRNNISKNIFYNIIP